MRMLSKLAAHAEQGTPQARTLADSALRDQVRGLLTGWDLADPNPEAYGQALQRLSQAGPGLAAPAQQMHAPEPDRVVKISLEADAVGPNVWRACATMVDTGRLAELVGLLEEASPDIKATQELWERAVSTDSLRWLLVHEPVDFATVDRLLPRLGERAADPLLDTLAEAEVRATRRAVLDRLKGLGPALGPNITGRLGDERWYVKRNLLTLLDELPKLPAGFSALQWLSHEDARVRLEAFKLGLKAPEERDRAIIQALADPEPRLTRMALIAARQGIPARAVPRVIALANNRQIPWELRLQAIRVLGGSRSPHAVEVLLAMTDGGRTLLRRPKLPPKSPELLAALSALATGWGVEPRATAVLARAALSSDPEIRAATDPTSRTA